ncbi:TolC family protein [bacterium]|nr:TolC family protein [bacterium]
MNHPLTRGLSPLLAAATLAVATLPAQAAEQPLDLRAAVSAALDTSPAVTAAEAKIGAAEARQGEANARVLPTVTLSAMPVHIGILDNNLSRMLKAMAPGLSLDFMLSETLTVTQPLFTGGRIGLGREAAEAGKAMAQEGARLSRQNVAFETATYYLNVLRAESLLEAVLENDRQAQAHLKDAQAREKNGLGTRFDTLQAQTALANVKGRVIQARNAVKLARLSLSTAIHQPLNDRPLAAPSLPMFKISESSIASGIEARPEVKVAQGQQKINALSTEISRRSLLPTVGVQGILLADKLNVPGYAVMGSASWELFDGGKVHAQIRAGEKTEEADVANLQAMREGLRLEVEKAIADRSEAKERITAAEQGLKAAQAGYDLAQLRYSEGAGTGTEAIDAASTMSQARATYIQATYDALAAELKIAKALGLDLAGMLRKA